MFIDFIGKVLPSIITGFVSIVIALIGIDQQNKKSSEKMISNFTLQISEVKASQQQIVSTIELIKNNFEHLKHEVEKHNNVIERTYELEKNVEVAQEKIKVASHRIEDLENDVKKLNSHE